MWRFEIAKGGGSPPYFGGSGITIVFKGNSRGFKAKAHPKTGGGVPPLLLGPGGGGPPPTSRDRAVLAYQEAEILTGKAFLKRDGMSAQRILGIMAQGHREIVLLRAQCCA